jgi:ATP-dependent DNA helicase RecG
MEPLDLIELIQKGENSTVQFKERITDGYDISKELVAFSNTKGGVLIIGVNDKTKELNGLTYEEIQATSTLLANVASDQIKSPIYLFTETIKVGGQILIVATVKEGSNKPYMDRNGIIWIKNASDKRKVVSKEEIMILLQESNSLYADEVPVNETSLQDIDIDYYSEYVERKFKRSLDAMGIDLRQSLENMNLLKGDHLTLAGLLIFGKNRHKFKPLFSIQCVSVYANTLSGNEFVDNEPPFEGNLDAVFNKTISFIDRNLKKVSSGDSFNSRPVWEIPYEVFEELIVNSLIHRDYFINSTIKVYVFSDRIEIISPGKLPNSLTVGNIMSGISIPRNPILHSIAQYALPYKGLGTGVMRAISIYPQITFINEQDKEQFIAIIKRP